MSFAITDRRRFIIGMLILAALIVFPFVVPRPQFWVVSVGLRALWLGIVAMSVIWLVKSTGMLSLGQLTFWGVAGYMVAILSTRNDVHYLISLPLAVLIGTAVGFVVALICVRTQGVYFLMLTLAVSQLGYFLVLQAARVTGGFEGIGGINRPAPFGLSFSDRNVLYFVALALAVGTYLLCRYVSRTPFGLALEGIRDSPERMRALGYSVYWYRVAAFTLSSFIASVSGMLALFYHGRITPGAVDMLRSIDVLIVSVLGGINSLAGAFVGSTALTVLQNFSQHPAIPVRRLTLTGLIFVAVLLFLPGGIVGLVDQVRHGWSRFRGGKGSGVSADHRGSAPLQKAAITEERPNTIDGQL
jgi:branched-chain amino acid transport system permease protein